MPIVVTPELGIPLPFDTTKEEIEDFRLKAHALFETVQELIKQGATVAITDQDKAESHQIAANGQLPPVKTLTPGTIINLEALLSEWDHEVLDVGRRLRNYVTNKLIMDSNDTDPRVRIKVLELLGKLNNVGLFSDRVEVNVVNRSIDSIEQELAKTLELYMGKVDTVENAIDAPPSIGDINLDEVLGKDESGTTKEG